MSKAAGALLRRRPHLMSYLQMKNTMPKARRYYGQRLSKAPASRAPRRKEDGRPRGTVKRFPFEQTRLGFMIRYEMPVVYCLLRRLAPPAPLFEPSWQQVEAVCRASCDPSARKPKFRRYIEEYARQGVYCKRGKRLTPQRRRYYAALCRRKAQKYIARNRTRLEALLAERTPGIAELKDILKTSG